MKKSKRAVAAIILLSALVLSGCEDSGTIITPIENPEEYYAAPTEAPVSVTDSGEVIGYNAEGFYNDQTASINGVIEADTRIEDYLPEESFSFDADDVRGEVPSTAGSMEIGDLTMGIVTGQDAVVNPLRCTFTDLNNINRLVFESLVELDGNLQPTPLLADRWTYNQSNKVWTFVLRQNVRFHNGEVLTSDDVVASFRDIQQHSGTVWSDIITPIQDMQALDDITLQVKSKGPGYMVLYAMTFPIVQQSTIDYALPMGTGPYWYTGYDVGHSIRLEKNPLWWKRSTSTVESVVAICYRTIQAALTGLELGEINSLATDYPTASLSRNLQDRMTLDYSTNTYECLVPNLRDQIMSDLSVRQAIMYAVDRSTLANQVYAGMAQECEVPVIPGSWIYNAQTAQYNYMPERALQILLDDGWEDKNGDGLLEKDIGGREVPLRLTLITYDKGTTSTRTEAADMISQQLRKVGIDVNVRVGSQNEVVNAMSNGKFDLALCAFELNVIPYLQFLLSSNGSSNYSRYNNELMDGYIRDSSTAVTADEYREAMYLIQQQVADDLPIMGLFFRAGVLVVTKRLGNLSGMHQGDVLRGLATATDLDEQYGS